MSDVINGVPRELLEFIVANARGVEREKMDKLRALLSEQPQASAAQSAHHCSNCLGVHPESCMFAQSAPAGEREALSAYCRAFREKHGQAPLWPEQDDRFHYFQAGAAWQRAQSAGVPEGWRVERRELDGSVCFIIGSPRIAGVRSNTSVWESDSDPAHLLLWHMLAAAPAQPEAHDQGDVQRLREALERLRAELDIDDNLRTVRLVSQIDAALAASTGQEV